MIGADIICTDEACALTTDIAVDTLDELELLTCDHCGCSTQTLAIWDVIELHPAAPVTHLHRAKPPLAA